MTVDGGMVKPSEGLNFAPNIVSILENNVGNSKRNIFQEETSAGTGRTCAGGGSIAAGRSSSRRLCANSAPRAVDSARPGTVAWMMIIELFILLDEKLVNLFGQQKVT